MSKDIKKALEHCIDNECVGCPNNEELGSGDIVCRARLLPEILEYISDLQHRLEVTEKALNKMAKDWCLIDNPNKPSDVVKKYKEQAKKEYTQQGIKGQAKELTLKKGQELSYEEKRLLGYFPKETS